MTIISRCQVLQQGEWAKIKKTSKCGKNCHFLADFWCFFEFISILTAWSQLLTLHLNSTNFGGNFETTYSSGSVLIRNLIFSMEFVICGKILDEKSLCAISLIEILLIPLHRCMDMAMKFLQSHQIILEPYWHQVAKQPKLSMPISFFGKQSLGLKWPHLKMAIP